MAKIFLTICSSKKNSSKDLLPAHKRYASKRIELIHNKAKQQVIPFYILSAEFGLISESKAIPDYDHLLTMGEVDELARMVVKQLKQLDFDEIDFYAKERSNAWLPYYQAIEEATRKTNIKLNIIEIQDNE